MMMRLIHMFEFIFLLRIQEETNLKNLKWD